MWAEKWVKILIRGNLGQGGRYFVADVFRISDFHIVNVEVRNGVFRGIFPLKVVNHLPHLEKIVQGRDILGPGKSLRMFYSFPGFSS